MKVRDVIIVGAGIAGCAVALALVKRGIAVTLVTSSLDQRAYHGSFIQQELLEERVRELQQDIQGHLGCSRAAEQLIAGASKSLDELLMPYGLIDRYGNVDIHRCLQEQLKEHPSVEWIANHRFIDLLTLDQHSTRRADVYRKPTCVGIRVYRHEDQKVEDLLAKEVILATGGAVSLFPYSSHPPTARGESFAIAHRAGVRLVNMGDIQFHPLALYERNRPCLPLPIELLEESGKLYTSRMTPLENITPDKQLASQLYIHLLHHSIEHFWLDLTVLDAGALKDRFPAIDAYCLHHGFNIAKDLLPVVPVASYTCGGMAIDHVGQTNVQRLRAIGEAACTGLFCDFRDEALGVLESLTWAVTCADDIEKHLSKFIYYFPDLKSHQRRIVEGSPMIAEDWRLLRQILWSYVGIVRQPARLERAITFLEKLKFLNQIDGKEEVTIEQIHLQDAIQTALLIAKGARSEYQLIEEDASLLEANVTANCTSCV